jgi:hypothetical protein
VLDDRKRELEKIKEYKKLGKYDEYLKKKMVLFLFLISFFFFFLNILENTEKEKSKHCY